jgi:PAS domain S-box-containing protein
VDNGGIILAVNPAFAAMTGYSSGELIGKRCTILNCTGCEILEPGLGQQWCALFLKGSIHRRRCEIAAKDGRIIHVIKSATVLHDHDGRASGAVETISDITEMVQQEEQIRSLRCSLYQQQGDVCGIVGNSQPIQRLLNLIENVAQSDAPVLIYGESGVGKELVAHAIHTMGTRTKSNFVKVNCASLNENLLESELFGHVKGAFTGAGRTRVGRFEAASGGSIFLDEIGDISPSIQVKLLRVLESKEVERVGDHRPIPVDARIVTATNRDLEDLVARGSFRPDLFYRINVVPIHVPALRERKEDIPLLAQVFIDRIAAKSGKSILGLSREALDVMLAYDWPGNVRELRNAIEYAFVLCHEDLIGPQHLSDRIFNALSAGGMTSRATLSTHADYRPHSHDFSKGRAEFMRILKQARGNQSEAARLLGVSRVTVWKKIKKYGINLEKDLL